MPLVRDFNLAMGGLIVSHPSIEASINRGNSVLIVTGGQAEMLHTKISDTDLTMITRHVGFIRMAIANRVPLVPLIALGENNVLGLLQFPSIQSVALKIVGFPFPVLPYGRWFLPLPYRAHVALLVGKPIDIPASARHDNPEDVQALSEKYFSELHALFDRRRA
uniref:Diacylglycerol O-acyltransferase 2B n=1 Tax=Lygus hesperus TaxID=30085 RepID=A0A0A9VW62_LYGHE